MLLSDAHVSASRLEPPRLERAPSRPTPAAGEARAPAPRWVRRLLGVPIAWKIAGANVVIGAAAVVAVCALRMGGTAQGLLMEVLAVTLVLALVVNTLLVRTALRPLLALEATADRVWRGDFSARVPPSLLADRDMARVGGTLNLLLDSIERDRARLRRQAARIVQAEDAERARVARELHDSVAQTLAALTLQIGAARRNAPSEGPLGEQLELVRAIAGAALEEVRLLSHTVHPSVLDDLGLPAALEWLARQTRDAEALDVEVVAPATLPELPAPAAAALYRVAQEALRNAVRHAGAGHITLRLEPGRGELALEVVDDGRGFDVTEAEERRPGMGLFAMRERVELVDGQLEIVSIAGSGTRVRASVPIAGGVIE